MSRTMRRSKNYTEPDPRVPRIRYGADKYALRGCGWEFWGRCRGWAARQIGRFARRVWHRQIRRDGQREIAAVRRGEGGE